MEQHATELYQWIEAGANVYVCGSKDPMSVDVENTLIKIIAAHKIFRQKPQQRFSQI